MELVSCPTCHAAVEPSVTSCPLCGTAIVSAPPSRFGPPVLPTAAPNLAGWGAAPVPPGRGAGPSPVPAPIAPAPVPSAPTRRRRSVARLLLPVLVVVALGAAGAAERAGASPQTPPERAGASPQTPPERSGIPSSGRARAGASLPTPPARPGASQLEVAALQEALQVLVIKTPSWEAVRGTAQRFERSYADLFPKGPVTQRLADFARAVVTSVEQFTHGALGTPLPTTTAAITPIAAAVANPKTSTVQRHSPVNTLSSTVNALGDSDHQPKAGPGTKTADDSPKGHGPRTRSIQKHQSDGNATQGSGPKDKNHQSPNKGPHH